MKRVLLVHLPDDILVAITRSIAAQNDEPRASYARTVSRLEEVYYAKSSRCTGEHPLLPLSMTCSRLRRICLPILFRLLAVNSSVARRSQQLPTVLEYFSSAHIDDSLPEQTLAAILAAAKGVYELKCFRTILPFVFSTSSVTDITLCNVAVRWDSPPVQISGRPLRAFRMVFSSRWAGLHTWEAEDLHAELKLVESQVLPSRSWLEKLVLPGESTRLSSLTSAQWPSLREFALVGAYPSDAGWVPLVDVLCMLPRLRVLTIGLAPRRCQSPLHVWPPGAASTRPPALELLTRFSLSFPLEDDLIFAHLPTDLTELALRDSPRFYRRTVSGGDSYTGKKDPNDVGYAAPGPLLTCQGAMRILSVIPSQPRLQRFELVIRSENPDSEIELYARIAETCPGLRVFELHRYRTDDHSGAPTAIIIEALRAFQSLTELRLNLDFPPFTSLGGHIVDYEQMSRLLDESAKLVSAALPWLRRVAFLEKHPTNIHYWTTWTVTRTDDGVLAERGPRLSFKA